MPAGLEICHMAAVDAKHSVIGINFNYDGSVQRIRGLPVQIPD